MFIVVSYDIVDNKKRTKLAKQMCNYGQRVQYSVFECNINAQQLKKMKKEALQFVDLQKDSLRIYKFCRDCKNKVESFGIKRGFEDEEGAIVI
jgi:CRISPR-associated protein Cas2